MIVRIYLVHYDYIHFKCRSIGLKEAQCIEGYHFATGEIFRHIACVKGEWRFAGKTKIEETGCSPVCQHKCMNGGYCIAPNRCKCPLNTTGEHCEEKMCNFLPIYGKVSHKNLR